jgi:hypothetical protein
MATADDAQEVANRRRDDPDTLADFTAGLDDLTHRIEMLESTTNDPGIYGRLDQLTYDLGQLRRRVDRIAAKNAR